MVIEFDPDYQDGTTIRQDIQLAITLNPDLVKFERAMESYKDQEVEEVVKKLATMVKILDNQSALVKSLQKRNEELEFEKNKFEVLSMIDRECPHCGC